MIPGSEAYPFLPMNPAAGTLGLMPLLPLRLELPPHSIAVPGLLDTASAVNVLPYDVGLQLGAVWAQQTRHVQLTGNLASVPARGLVVSAIVGQFPPVRLAFAWANRARFRCYWVGSISLQNLTRSFHVLRGSLK
jgi:hypothetical protein